MFLMCYVSNSYYQNILFMWWYAATLPFLCITCIGYIVHKDFDFQKERYSKFFFVSLSKCANLT